MESDPSFSARSGGSKLQHGFPEFSFEMRSTILDGRVPLVLWHSSFGLDLSGSDQSGH
jgi:hypothetical protein